MSVIGIDPSIDHPAFALWPARQTWQLQTEGEGAARLDDLFCKIRGWCANYGPDDLEAVFVERATGNFSQPALYQANGVIQVAIKRGFAGLFPHPVSVFEVSPGTWKKQALGSGRAKKDDVFYWAVDRLAENGYANDDLTQDEADALAIACAGHKLLSTEREGTRRGSMIQNERSRVAGVTHDPTSTGRDAPTQEATE